MSKRVASIIVTPEDRLTLGGHFLYIAVSDLIPEMYRGERSWAILLVHLGAVLSIIVVEWLVSL